MQRTVRKRIWAALVSGALAATACASSTGDGPPPTDAAPASTPAPDPEQIRAGEALFFDCIACHTTGRGEPHLQGPNLWGIVGSAAGTRPGFPYSEALANADFVWNAETLDQWLRKPSEFIPGTLMAYVGMADPEKRAALIAYLSSVTSAE